MKKITVELKLRILIHADEDSNLTDLINELEIDVQDTTGEADIIDTEVLDFEIQDAR